MLVNASDQRPCGWKLDSGPASLRLAMEAPSPAYQMVQAPRATPQTHSIVPLKLHEHMVLCATDENILYSFFVKLVMCFRSPVSNLTSKMAAVLVNPNAKASRDPNEFGTSLTPARGEISKSSCIFVLQVFLAARGSSSPKACKDCIS